MDVPLANLRMESVCSPASHPHLSVLLAVGQQSGFSSYDT